jgi:hypothetical protein
MPGGWGSLSALRWCDAPDLPDGLAVRDVAAQVQFLLGRDRLPIGQLFTLAGITAARTGHTATVGVTDTSTSHLRDDPDFTRRVTRRPGSDFGVVDLPQHCPDRPPAR